MRVGISVVCGTGKQNTYTLTHLSMQFNKIDDDLLFGLVFASDFVDTPEQFGTVPLHSAAFGDAIQAICLNESVKLEGGHTYIARAWGCRCRCFSHLGKR